MLVGIITGTGTTALPGFEDPAPERLETEWGAVEATRGRLAGVEALHISRHGEGHVRLSNHVEHRANVAALKRAGCAAVVGCTVCGVVDPGVPLGALVVFDDLYFPGNRLPDGSICSFFAQAGDPRSGHWIPGDAPFSEPLRAALVAGAAKAAIETHDGGCYGHVDGPRFETRAEVVPLATAGVALVSQTAGPETVLCGEAELPFALMGVGVNHVPGVSEQPTSPAELEGWIARSGERFAAVLAAALPQLDAQTLAPAGLVHRLTHD